MPDHVEVVDGSPTKRFFIDILTRDISLSAAILDLVDNSVDSAVSLRLDGDLTGLGVDIRADPQAFSIEDNCAGIGAQRAREYVFRMGRPAGTHPTPESIGQFGVGMKRALFKLGTAFTVESVSDSDSFTVDLNLADWVGNDHEWGLPMAVHDHVDSGTGTTIVVTPLREEVSVAFGNPDFLQELREELRSRHRLAMGNGLAISLNGEALSSADSTVAISELLSPALRSLVVRTPTSGDLDVRIVVGIAGDGSGEVDEDAEPEAQGRPAADAGWLVFGNGRLLLANDKTRLTGWGSGRNKMPQYHNQYARFRGFVYMTARDSAAIPWNTMKTSVDPDSPVWQQVLSQMIEAARSVIVLLNHAKVERQLATENMATPISDAIRSATPVDAISVFEVHFSMSIAELRADPIDATFPDPNPELVESWKKIQYSVIMTAFDDLAAALGKTNAAEIGRMSFDYLHKSVLGSDA